jgi:hypothetical protein
VGCTDAPLGIPARHGSLCSVGSSSSSSSSSSSRSRSGDSDGSAGVRGRPDRVPLPLYYATTAKCHGGMASCDASIVEAPANLWRLTERFAAHAEDFLARNGRTGDDSITSSSSTTTRSKRQRQRRRQRRPFLLFVAPTEPHTPHTPMGSPAAALNASREMSQSRTLISSTSSSSSAAAEEAVTSTTRAWLRRMDSDRHLGEGVPPGDVYALSMRQADRLVRRLCRAVRTHVDREDDDQDEDEEDHGDGGGGGDDDSGRPLCGKNTMLVVTSDNGPWRVQGAFGGSGGPFAGGKFTSQEGGFRVPALIHWPGAIRIPKKKKQKNKERSRQINGERGGGGAGGGGVGAVVPLDRAAVMSMDPSLPWRCDALVSALDLFPTFLSAAGVTTPSRTTSFFEGKEIDGRDLMPLLLGHQRWIDSGGSDDDDEGDHDNNRNNNFRGQNRSSPSSPSLSSSAFPSLVQKQPRRPHDHHRDFLWLQGMHGALSPLRIGRYKVMGCMPKVEVPPSATDPHARAKNIVAPRFPFVVYDLEKDPGEGSPLPPTAPLDVLFTDDSATRKDDGGNDDGTARYRQYTHAGLLAKARDLHRNLLRSVQKGGPSDGAAAGRTKNGRGHNKRSRDGGGGGGGGGAAPPCCMALPSPRKRPEASQAVAFQCRGCRCGGGMGGGGALPLMNETTCLF